MHFPEMLGEPCDEFTSFAAALQAQSWIEACACEDEAAQRDRNDHGAAQSLDRKTAEHEQLISEPSYVDRSLLQSTSSLAAECGPEIEAVVHMDVSERTSSLKRKLDQTEDQQPAKSRVISISSESTQPGSTPIGMTGVILAEPEVALPSQDLQLPSIEPDVSGGLSSMFTVSESKSGGMNGVLAHAATMTREQWLELDIEAPVEHDAWLVWVDMLKTVGTRALDRNREISVVIYGSRGNDIIGALTGFRFPSREMDRIELSLICRRQNTVTPLLKVTIGGANVGSESFLGSRAFDAAAEYLRAQFDSPVGRTITAIDIVIEVDQDVLPCQLRAVPGLGSLSLFISFISVLTPGVIRCRLDAPLL